MITITNAGLTTSEFLSISEGCERVELSAECGAAVQAASVRLETLIDAGATIYGVTPQGTGSPLAADFLDRSSRRSSLIR